MQDDSELLRRFAADADERAFRALVDRHLPLVYASALRQLNGDSHHAADVAQVVFTDLARKARALVGHRALAGWLFTSTRYAAAKTVRSEQRRRVREQEAQTMEDLNHDPAGALDWSRVRPVLDAALAELPERDREALLLRYFEHCDYGEIGAQYGVADNTARMRVERSLDRLRTALARRGVTSTAAALATALGAEAVGAVPAGLAGHVTGAALAATAGATWFSAFMGMTKLQVGLAGALAAAAGTGVAIQARTNAGLREQVAALHAETAALPAARQENLQLARRSAEVAMLRADNTAFARMGAEAADLKRRLAVVAQVQRQQAAALAARRMAEQNVRSLDSQPVPLRRTPPKYPEELRTLSVPGKAVVAFIVDQNGDVLGASVVSATNPEFGKAAVEAVSEWKFRAGIKGGRHVNTRMEVPIVFAPPSQPASPGVGTPPPNAVNNPDPAQRAAVAMSPFEVSGGGAQSQPTTDAHPQPQPAPVP